MLVPLLLLIISRRLIYYAFFRKKVVASLKIEISFFMFFLPIFAWIIIIHYVNLNQNIGMIMVFLSWIIVVKVFCEGYLIEKNSLYKS